MPDSLRSDRPTQPDPAQLYELLVAELTDFAVFLTDPNGSITTWNPGVESLLGYTEAEWIGQPAHIIFTPEDRAARMPEQEMATAARDGRSPDVRWHQRKDGSCLFVEGTMVALKDGAGTLLGFSKVMHDVTARKRAEEELRQQWHMFDTALSHTPDFSYIFDRQGRFTYVNRALLSLWQKPLDEAVGKNFFDLDYPQELAEHLQSQIQQVIDTQRTVRDETPFIGPTGETRYYEYIFVPVLGPAGQVEAVAGSTRDLTERRVTEVERERLRQQIEAERQRLHQVFQQAPVAVAVFRGPEYIVDLANPFYHRLVRNRILVGRRFIDFVPEIGHDVLDAFYQVMTTGEPYVRDDFYIPYDQDGDGVVEDHWFNVLYHPLREVDGMVSGLVTVCTEVTTQVRARQALEQVNRGLEEFAHAASHDLQEPLRTVHSYSQLLVRRLGTDLTEEQKEFVGFILQGVKRMEQLIKDLLTYSRTVHTAEGLATSQASLEKALRQALSSVQTRSEEAGAVITQNPLPTARGDVTQLAHVFQNLLSNALKYRKVHQPPQIHIQAVRQENLWVISVRDNGIGFDPSHAEHIFGLFKRLHKDEYPGTGVGLAICQRIVERYGGRMWADSEPGVGSTFFFSLPAVLS